MMRWRRTHYQDKETIVTLLCKSEFISAGMEALRSVRIELEDYIAADPVFAKTHAPHDPMPDASDLVRQMCSATRLAGVGPMASVAGAFASKALEQMIRSGAKEGVVDNGGDIALTIREPILMGIYAGKSSIRNLAFQIEPRDSILGICTSSGTVGHSFSYGIADAAVVISGNVILADAAATALGNRIHSSSDLESCFDFLKPITEIEGALVILDDRMAMWGDLPKLVRMHVDETLITAGYPGLEF
jgi:ApbE superfamily uncharacterized protein (UPF0280 family)